MLILIGNEMCTIIIAVMGLAQVVCAAGTPIGTARWTLNSNRNLKPICFYDVEGRGYGKVEILCVFMFLIISRRRLY